MGDSVLRGMAEVIKRNLRSTDVFARYGGEEFVVILSETGKSGAIQMAERIREVVERHRFPHGETQPKGRLTVSAGVGSFAPPMTMEELIKKTDDALYMAKTTGRNRVAG
jgi:diguanylate cyclase (GGDEF)-like protein